MKMLRISYLVLVALFFSGSVMAQSGQVWCGTSDSDQAEMIKSYLEKADEIFNQNVIRSGAVTYLPVKFHLMSASGGVGEIGIASVFKQLCRLNTDYASVDIQFYLKGGIDNGILRRSDDRVWMDPSTTTARAVLRSIVSINRDAINIFINNSAETGSGSPGVVLGFYYRPDDYIVIKRSEVISVTSSLTHELGHFLGLVHTFWGWEGTEYDCNTPTPISVLWRGQPVPVEYVSRTKFTNGQLNCRVAADGLCDTQADYNLGLGYVGPCSSFTGCGKDPDGVTLTPFMENFMGYFLNCLSTYSDEQHSVMLSEIASARRNYIRSTYVPDLTELSERTLLISPENNATSPYFDEVDLEWEASLGAQAYILEVDRTPNFSTGLYQELLYGTSATVTGLLASKNYYWRVTPVAEYHNCPPTASSFKFTTSSVMTSTNAISGLESWAISPNPSPANSVIKLEMTLTQPKELTIDVFGLTGNEVYRYQETVSVGANLVQFTPNLDRGIYMVRISDGIQSVASKLVIK
jgi:hypothetical protein